MDLYFDGTVECPYGCFGRVYHRARSHVFNEDVARGDLLMAIGAWYACSFERSDILHDLAESIG
jgi:hypothetical protein